MQYQYFFQCLQSLLEMPVFSLPELQAVFVPKVEDRDCLERHRKASLKLEKIFWTNLFRPVFIWDV
jgi:hypothetical protein